MQLVFATHNENKLKEVRLLMPQHITLLSLNDIGCLEIIPETGATLEENALLKANHVTKNYGYACFADDTGLLVDAMHGAPGVYSARYAGEDGNADRNMDKLLNALKDSNERSAHFKTVIALNLKNETLFFKGIVQGEITKTKHGEGGFGYDPIFRPMGYDVTFAELSISKKNEISHRGMAIRELTAYLNN